LNNPRRRERLFTLLGLVYVALEDVVRQLGHALPVRGLLFADAQVRKLRRNLGRNVRPSTHSVTPILLGAFEQELAGLPLSFDAQASGMILGSAPELGRRGVAAGSFGNLAHRSDVRQRLGL